MPNQGVDILNLRENDGSIKIVVIVAIIITVFIIGIIASLITNSSKPVKPIIQDPYEYFTLYSLDGTVGVVNKNGEEIIKSEYSQIYIPNQAKDVFICFKDDENYSILNSKGKDIFTEYKSVSSIVISDSTLEMEKNVLSYEDNGKYGLINYDGKKLTDPIYESVSSLTNKPGCILVRKDGLYGVLDSQGKIIIDTKYNSIKGDEYCSEKEGYLKTGYIISEKTNSGIMYGYIDYNGKVLIEPKYESISRNIEYDDDNIYLTFMENGKKGVIKNKKVIIKPKFQSVVYYNVSNIFVVNRNGKYGFFDKDGEEILKTSYTSYSIAGNYISVQKDDSTMLYDIHGNLVNTNNYKSIVETGNPAYFIAQDENGYYSIISKDMQIGNGSNYTNITYAFNNFFVFTTQEGKTGILDIYAGTEVEAQYDYIIVLENVKALEARAGNKVDIYSEKIEKVLSMEDAIVQKVNDDYVSIYSATEIEYINKVGELVKNTEVFKNAKLYTYKAEDGKWGFADSNGKIVVDCKYDRVTELNEYGYAGVCQDGKWGVIDDKGKVVVVPAYEIETYYAPTFLGKYQYEVLDNAHCKELEEK